MEITLTIIIVLIIIQAILILFYVYNYYRLNVLNKLKDRSEDVHKYRCDLIDRDLDSYKKLPDYDTMIHSKKPLTDEYWIKTINQ